MTKNISLTIRDISHPGPVNSDISMSVLGARNDGCGYLSTRKLVPGTMPGSISSSVVVLLLLLALNRVKGEVQHADDERGWRDDDADGVFTIRRDVIVADRNAFDCRIIVVDEQKSAEIAYL